MQSYAIDNRSLELIKGLLKLDEKFLKKHKKYSFEATSPIAFLACCIPLYVVFQLKEWNTLSEGYRVLTFVLYVLTAIFIGRFLRDEKRIYRFIKIIPLPFIFFLQFFTNVTLFSSNKIFLLLYLIFGTLLSILIHWKSNKDALGDFNKDLIAANKRAAEIVEELNLINNKKDERSFWWESSSTHIEKPTYDTYTSTDFRFEGDTEKEMEKVFFVEFRKIPTNVSEITNELLKKSKRYTFGLRAKNMYVSRDDSVTAIYIVQNEKHKITKTVSNGLTPEQLERARRRIDKQYDAQERLENSNWLTHQQNDDIAMMTGDREAQSKYLNERTYSDFMRKLETEAYIRQNTTQYRGTKRFEPKKRLIGYVISGNLVIFDDTEYDKIITKLQDVIFYRYACIYDAFENVFKKTIGERYSEYYKTQIASTIAHNFSLLITN